MLETSCVTAAPFYDLDGARIRLGKPICLSHDKGHSIEQFIKMLDGLAMVFKENEDLVEKLGNTQIKHPGGVFYISLTKTALSDPDQRSSQMSWMQNFLQDVQRLMFFLLK